MEDQIDQLSSVSTQSLISFGIAICIHSLIDGLAVGVYDELETIVILAISIVVHKIPVAVTVGQTFRS
jgi:zinc transporter ZupT